MRIYTLYAVSILSGIYFGHIFGPTLLGFTIAIFVGLGLGMGWKYIWPPEEIK